MVSDPNLLQPAKTSLISRQLLAPFIYWLPAHSTARAVLSKTANKGRLLLANDRSSDQNLTAALVCETAAQTAPR
jgi:hypothetical protein